jgi:hypothetical protein
LNTETLKLNTLKVSSIIKLWDFSINDAANRKVIKYVLDEDENISEIYPPMASGDNPRTTDFRVLYPMMKRKFKSSPKAFIDYETDPLSPKAMYVNTNAPVFILPIDPSNDEVPEKYQVMMVSSFSNDQIFTIESYTDANSMLARVAVAREETEASFKPNRTMLIERVTTYMDEKGEIRYRLIGAIDRNANKTIVLRQDEALVNTVKNFGRGDFIMFRSTYKGEVDSVLRFYDASKKLCLRPTGSYNSLRGNFGKIIHNAEGIITIQDDGGVTYEFNASAVNKICKYSFKRGNVTQASLDDLNPGCNVLCITVDEGTKEIVIYE